MHREHALGRRQKQVMELLADGEPRTIGDLYHAVVISPESMHSAIGPLVKKGLVDRVARGVYRLSTESKGSIAMAREFIVLSRNGVGWIPAQTVEAPTAALAVEKVADGEGSYVAVPASYWNELRVGTVTKLAVIQEPVSA